MTARKANPPRRNHFVAVMMLDRFADADRLLWVYDKRNPVIRRSTSEAIFYEKDFHTFYKSDGSKDTSLEDFFADLESESSAVIERICLAARCGKLPKLTSHERDTWNTFFYYQWKRTPDFLKAAQFEQKFDGVLQSAISAFTNEIRPLTDVEQNLVASPSFIRDLKNNTRVNALRDIGRDAKRAISALGLGIGRITKSNKSFVIGTKPVVKLGPPKRAVLGDPEVEVWLPIAHDIVVCMVPNGGQELLAEMDDKRVRDLNESLFKQSSSIASKSKDLLISLTKAPVRS